MSLNADLTYCSLRVRDQLTVAADICRGACVPAGGVDQLMSAADIWHKGCAQPMGAGSSGAGQGMPGERVFIGPLGDNVRQGDIRSFFKHVGNVKLVIRKRGFAFVDFANPREALRAIRRNDGQRLLGRRVRVEMAHELERRERQQRDQHHTSSSRVGLPLQGGNSNECVHSMHDLPRISNYRVKVDNLSLKVTWMELKSLFNLISEVAYAAVCHQYRLGFVEFRSFAGMEKAIAHLNGYILKGRRISVYPTNTKGRSQSIASESK
uniref:RRM domain-containing protein n=1 Tax=Trichuris muris TaxID=70415 RepID=A0A5S6Q517_TRIMR